MCKGMHLLVAILAASWLNLQGIARADTKDEGPSAEPESPKQAFNTLYAKYQEQIELGDNKAALKTAYLAWQAGTDLFGKENINTVNLALNYAALLNEFEQFKEALPILSVATRQLEKSYGKNDRRLVLPLVELGAASSVATHKVSPLFKRAIRLAKAEVGIIEAANINLEVGRFVERELHISGFKYFQAAYNMNMAELGPDHINTAIAAIDLGGSEISKKRYKSARTHLEQAVGIFTQSDTAERRFELIARARLIAVLEHLGKSDLATEQCLAIGRKSPLSPDDDYLPLYKVNPKYPRSDLSRRHNGEVIYEFTVDEQGFTRDHRVVVATNKNFAKAALEAVKKFRYAPRFENNKAVSTTGVQNRITFMIQ